MSHLSKGIGTYDGDDRSTGNECNEMNNTGDCKDEKCTSQPQCHQSLFTAEYCSRPDLGAHVSLANGIPAWKRTLDIVGAVSGLVILSPLLLATATLIKVLSPGHIFFIQERVGFRGKLFALVKFRTMKGNANTVEHQKHMAVLIQGGDDAGDGMPMIKLDSSPQIIPFGKFMRKFYLDELPQL
ncbi:sugar transferase, partial [Candidatus Hydrogenedentota bacterium]